MVAKKKPKVEHKRQRLLVELDHELAYHLRMTCAVLRLSLAAAIRQQMRVFITRNEKRVKGYIKKEISQGFEPGSPRQ